MINDHWTLDIGHWTLMIRHSSARISLFSTARARYTSDRRDSYDEHAESDQYPDRLGRTKPRGRKLRKVRDRDAVEHCVVNPCQAVARDDSRVSKTYVRAVSTGQTHDPGVRGGDELRRADSLLNVPARACGEIAQQKRAGDRSAKHGALPCGCANLNPGSRSR